MAAKLTLPNVDGQQPGAQVEMFSYDHDLEEFVAFGLGNDALQREWNDCSESCWSGSTGLVLSGKVSAGVKAILEVYYKNELKSRGASLQAYGGASGKLGFRSHCGGGASVGACFEGFSGGVKLVVPKFMLGSVLVEDISWKKELGPYWDTCDK